MPGSNFGSIQDRSNRSNPILVLNPGSIQKSWIIAQPARVECCSPDKIVDTREYLERKEAEELAEEKARE